MEIQELILEKLNKLDEKIDKMGTETIPNLMVDVAKLAEKTKADVKELNRATSSNMKLYTLIGGAITVAISIGTAVAIAMYK